MSRSLRAGFDISVVGAGVSRCGHEAGERGWGDGVIVSLGVAGGNLLIAGALSGGASLVRGGFLDIRAL